MGFKSTPHTPPPHCFSKNSQLGTFPSSGDSGAYFKGPQSWRFHYYSFRVAAYVMQGPGLAVSSLLQTPPHRCQASSVCFRLTWQKCLSHSKSQEATVKRGSVISALRQHCMYVCTWTTLAGCWRYSEDRVVPLPLALRLLE